ncbi:RNA polymerase sigma factor [Petropleomorpha daqingensis]|uniref:RNA polymerase sigma-70 factor (ECF subfamily) n=1 Tax=Petropleomorpha daqingensis TaxID=2026353 RepID=A0A853CKH7_9ACTN|nr:sigma-70 family RNA polymerase sigma factor [Petropleomorpha daqingensis]NYJ08574.1 RNA polymerase sigma-70 factor (ECF subfamily) [Petropleomorpha daqingensis]
MRQPEPSAPAVAAALLEGGSPGQAVLLERLRAGDRTAFAELVDAWSPVLLRVALLHVSTRASAEEVVQDTWLAVIGQLDRFEGRSSLRTWVFRILENQARTRGVREARAVPWSSAFPDQAEDTGPTVDPRRFRGPDDRWPGGWTPAGRPAGWEPPPEDAAVAAEIRRELRAALDELPERQRTVVELRDVHGLSSEEICATLGLSPGNQRILLHRGRARLRARLEDVYRSASGEGARRG